MHLGKQGESMANPQHKDSPINIRALASQRALIDRAAALRHMSRSDFMLQTACREAEEVLLDQRLFIADDVTYKAFLHLLESPLEANSLALRRLLGSKSPWEN